MELKAIYWGVSKINEFPDGQKKNLRAISHNAGCKTGIVLTYFTHFLGAEDAELPRDGKLFTDQYQQPEIKLHDKMNRHVPKRRRSPLKCKC